MDVNIRIEAIKQELIKRTVEAVTPSSLEYYQANKAQVGIYNTYC